MNKKGADERKGARDSGIHTKISLTRILYKYTIYGMLKEGQEYIVCWMVEPNDTVPLVDFLIHLKHQKHQLAVTAIAHLRRARHPANHGEPLTKAFKGTMKGILEIRAKTPQGYIRMPFIFAKDRRLIVLDGVVKKGKSLDPRTEKAMIKARNKLVSEEASYEEIDFSIFE